MEVFFGKQKILNSDIFVKTEVVALVSEKLNLENNEFYLISNGRRVSNENIIANKIYVALRTPGGKGGFGSMLRAIGAQIEKTTNREACRDLSGRRLRDINEEQRLKKWVAEQADREREAKEKKKKKLEKLLEQPRHEFVDQEYDQERSLLPEKVEDAVLKGLEASCSTKRKSDDANSKVAKKKPKLWMDSALDEDISSSESDNEDEELKPSVTKKNPGPESSQNMSEDDNKRVTNTNRDEITDNHINGESDADSKEKENLSNIVTEKNEGEITEIDGSTITVHTV